MRCSYQKSRGWGGGAIPKWESGGWRSWGEHRNSPESFVWGGCWALRLELGSFSLFEEPRRDLRKNKEEKWEEIVSLQRSFKCTGVCFISKCLFCSHKYRWAALRSPSNNWNDKVICDLLQLNTLFVGVRGIGLLAITQRGKWGQREGRRREDPWGVEGD